MTIGECLVLFLLIILLIILMILLRIVSMRRRKPVVRGVYDEISRTFDDEIIEHSQERTYRADHGALTAQRDFEPEIDEKLVRLEALRAEGKISEDAYERLKKELSSRRAG